MKSILIAIACLLCTTLVAAETVNRYSIAHTRHRDTDMVVVRIDGRFFNADLKTQARWYTDIQSCVRSVKLRGTVVLVSSANGRFQFYGPKSWHDFLKTIDMAWVNARINKEMTCHF
jgi:RNase P/RNase MRP subunit p30